MSLEKFEKPDLAFLAGTTFILARLEELKTSKLERIEAAVVPGTYSQHGWIGGDSTAIIGSKEYCILKATSEDSSRVWFQISTGEGQGYSGLKALLLLDEPEVVYLRLNFKKHQIREELKELSEENPYLQPWLNNDLVCHVTQLIALLEELGAFS